MAHEEYRGRLTLPIGEADQLFVTISLCGAPRRGGPGADMFSLIASFPDRNYTRAMAQSGSHLLVKLTLIRR